MHDALYSVIEDAQRYQTLANRADEALSRPAAVSQDEELAAFLRQVAGESAPCRGSQEVALPAGG